MFSALYRAYTRVICTTGYPHVDREGTFVEVGEVLRYREVTWKAYVMISLCHRRQQPENHFIHTARVNTSIRAFAVTTTSWISGFSKFAQTLNYLTA